MTEGPYKLPEGWRWVRLGEVCQCERRTVDPRRSPKATFYLYSIPAYDESQRPKRLDGSQIGSSKVVIGPGVCLFSKLNPRIPRAWVVAGVPQDGMPVASTEFMPLRPNPNVLDLDYLGKLLMTEWFVSQVRLDVTGATGSRQRLKPGVILNALVPLPPLPEQRRIVARIEELMSRMREAKRLRQQAEEDAERLWQSVLAETFPRPGSDLPEGWRWVRLAEVSRVFAGSPAPQGDHYFANGKHAFVRVSDLASAVDGRITKTRDAINERAINELRPGKASAGTIIFPKSGAAILTNARAMLAMDAYIVSHLAAVEPNQSVAEPQWLFFYLHTVDMAKYIDNPSYPSLKLSRIRGLPIPLPPLSEQRRIVAELEAVQEKLRVLREAQAETDEELKRLERSILDKAFRGEL